MYAYAYTRFICIMHAYRNGCVFFFFFFSTSTGLNFYRSSKYLSIRFYHNIMHAIFDRQSSLTTIILPKNVNINVFFPETAPLSITILKNRIYIYIIYIHLNEEAHVSFEDGFVLDFFVMKMLCVVCRVYTL